MSRRHASKSRKTRRILRRIATGILGVIIFVSFFAGLLWMLVDREVKNSGQLSVKLADTAFTTAVYESFEKSLERNMALVAIKPEDISHILTKEELSDEIPRGVDVLTSCLMGKPHLDYKYENEELLAEIARLLQAYADEHGVEFEEGSAEAVYGMVCDTVTAEVQLLSPKYADKIHGVTSKLAPYLGMWYVPFAVWALSIAGVLVIGRRRILNAVYNVILPTYLGSFTAFGAIFILHSKDYLANTVLGGTTLQLYLQGLYSGMLEGMRNASCFISLSLLIMGIIVSVALGMQHRDRKNHSYGSDADNGDDGGDSLIEDYGESEVPDETITEIVKRHEENN